MANLRLDPRLALTPMRGENRGRAVVTLSTRHCRVCRVFPRESLRQPAAQKFTVKAPAL
jgi:hypothetical protein